MTIGLRIDPEDQTVDPGRPAVFTIHVVNHSGVVDRVAIDVLGSAGGWATLDPPAVALFPGADATTVLTVTPPLGTALGPVPLGVRATAETSGLVEVGEATLHVGASRSVEAELRPRTATGKRRATSVIVLHNMGNAPTKVQVVASDPDDAIVFDAPTAVQIGPGMTTEVPLRMRLPTREKQGATLPYTVLVEGGDSGQALDGQVRQPAKKRWPAMALLLLVAAAVAAFVLLRPKDSVANEASRPDETTTTAPGATTTVPEVTTLPPGGVPPGGEKPAGTPGAPPPGGVVTTKAPVTTPPTVGGGGGVINLAPTTSPTTVAARCPGSVGTAQQKIAQSVICAWEEGKLSTVADRITDTGKKELGTSPLGGQSITGRPSADPLGTRVPFGGCQAGNPKGVASVVVATSGADNGKVVSVTTCSPPIGTLSASPAA